MRLKIGSRVYASTKVTDIVSENSEEYRVSEGEL